MAMKKIYVTLFALLVNAAFFSTSLNAQTADAPSSGDGSSGSPYQIATLNNLYWIYADNSRWDKYYIQTADINASDTENWTGGWFPIGDRTTNFTGSYDGQGNDISGLYVSRSSSREIGLFGHLGSDGVIKNVNLNGFNLTGRRDVGGIVGTNEGSVTNCSVAGSTANATAEHRVGALVGYNDGGTISYCTSSGSVKGVDDFGIVGGMVGVNEGTITYCYSTGTVSFTSNYEEVYAGGFVGENAGTISNSYSLTGVSGSTDSYSIAGGFAGKNTSSLTNCYSKGLVTGFDKAGFVSSNNGTITHCFWDTQTSGISTGSYGTGKTTAQMKTKTTFTAASWNFLDVWAIQASENSGYPFLPSWVKWEGDDSSFPTFWTTAANWSTGSVPSSSDYISISDQTSDPVIFSNTTINYLVIGDGAQLTVASNTLTISDDGVLVVSPGGKLSSQGTVTNSEGVSGLLVESDSDGTGSVILGNSVLGTVQRYITPSSTSVLFHIVSTPVSGQTIANFISENSSVIAYSSSGSVYAMRTYKADGTGWDDYYDGTELSNVIPGTSYSVGIKTNATTLVFKGTLVSSNQAKSIIGTGTGFGWNSIGNPFASSLNVKADANGFLNKYSNQLDASYTALYLWDPATSQYTVINSTTGQTYIGPEQGFIVKGKSGGGSMTFETGMRAHQTPTFYKSANAEGDWSTLVLQVKNSSDKIVSNSIVFSSNMTNDLDVSYDAGLLTDNESYSLFTKMPDVASDLKLMVQALPDTWQEPLAIPVGFQNDAGGLVEFSATSTSIPSDVVVWLEDRVANAFTQITAESYSVTMPAETDSLGRFFLHVGKAITSNVISTPDKLVYCENEVVDVTFTASAEGTVYKWYKNGDLIPDATSKTYNASSAGSYTALVAVGGSEVESNAISIIVNPLPDALVSTDDALTYCDGENVEVELTASPAGGTYQWFKNGEPIANAAAVGYTAIDAGEYSVEVTVNGCSAESEIKEVVVNELPTLTIPEDFSVCTGETTTITATGNADSYVWDNDIVNGEEFTPGETQTYSVTATITETGCQATDELTVTVNPLPEVNVPDDFGVCLGEDVMLIATGNANTYTWDNGVVNAQEFTPTETLTYTVVAANTATGCEATENVTVTVNPLPTVTVPDDFAVCDGDKVTLNATGDADAYIWDNDVTNGEEFVPEETETYNLIATITATGCESVDEVTVTVHPRPQFTMLNDSMLLAVQDQYLFDAGEGYSSYLWFDESDEQTYLFVGTDWGVGVYDVWVEVGNEFACTTRDTTVVDVKETTNVDVENLWDMSVYPNPTSGELNLEISGLTSARVNVTVVSSLGQKVFQNDFYVYGGEIKEKINLHSNASGIYMIIVNDGENKLTQRIVIE